MSVPELLLLIAPKPAMQESDGSRASPPKATRVAGSLFCCSCGVTWLLAWKGCRCVLLLLVLLLLHGQTIIATKELCSRCKLLLLLLLLPLHGQTILSAKKICSRNVLLLLLLLLPLHGQTISAKELCSRCKLLLLLLLLPLHGQIIVSSKELVHG